MTTFGRTGLTTPIEGASRGFVDPLTGKTVGSDRVAGRARLKGWGLVARFSPIPGWTRDRVLSSPLWLPVLVNNVTITDQATHNEYETLDNGTFSESSSGEAAAKQLTEVPLDTLLMDWDPSWFVVTRQDHHALGEALRRIHNWGDPVDLLITWHPHHHRVQRPVIHTAVTFRGLTREIRPGENDTRYVSVDVKEWRDATASVRRHKGHRAHLPTTHKLTAADTLHSLSKKYYHSYQHADDIRRANGIPAKFGKATPIVKLPRWHVGGKLKIPALPSPARKSVGTDRVRSRGG